MISAPPTVATLSAEAAALADDLGVIHDVLGGLRAMQARAGRYLPRYAAEDEAEHRRRVDQAPWRAEFADALASLSARPFTRPVTLPDAPEPALRFANDVDARGNCLHVFARSLFHAALADGMALIVIDAPRDAGKTVADQKATGYRPWWNLYPASNVIALRTEMLAGKREIVHLRLRENIVEPNGWGEVSVEQVRVLEPGAWSTWRQNEKKEWVLFETGPMFMAPGGGVPAVAMFTGERLGDLLVRPPLLDLALMNVELWRALSRQEEVLTYSGSPMLCARGVSAPTMGGSIEIGPKRVLYAPEGGAWSYVQPDAKVLREIREQIVAIQEDLQRLGLQPLIARPNVTATAATLSNTKAASQLEAWALALRDALETAIGMTLPLFLPDDRKALAGWKPVVDVHSDFSSEISKLEEARLVVDAAKAGLLQPALAARELQRRGVLGPALDIVDATEDALEGAQEGAG